MCISTHNLWKDKGSSSPGTCIGETKRTSKWGLLVKNAVFSPLTGRHQRVKGFYVYSYFKKRCWKKSKKLKPRPKGNMGFLWPATGSIGVLQPLKYITENSTERLSVSESISNRWTTLQTEVVGGPSNSCELKWIRWRQKRPWTTIGLN